jgi:glycosyltransferase involved in cell wall biosynthesis
MPKGFVVVFTGNVGVAQGLEVVIEAAQQLRQHNHIKWVIIGDGRARSALQGAVKELGLEDRILFLGRQPMHKIPGLLALSDVALLSLKAEPLFGLTLPTKIQSYLACGIPIIGSVDGDAARVIIESGAGFSGPASDAFALAQNVLRMYRSTSVEKEAFAKNALRYFAQNFRKEKLLTEIETHLNDLAPRRSLAERSSY